MNPLAWLNRLRQLPRDKADTLLLILSSVMVLAPHLSHLPLWIGAMLGVTLLWRVNITVRGSRLPPLALLMPLSLLAMAGVYRSFHTLLGRDAGVAMLALLLAFKLLEMHAKRDLFVVVFLSFFLLLTNFFYSQSMATALLMIATIVLLLTAQMTFQFTGALPSLLTRLRLGATVFVLAAPLGLLMFVAVPRVQGPLWGLPGDAHSGRTGLSETMAPGNVSSLAQSEDTAFRVRFTGPAPDKQQLYWRAIVLSEYDGRTWSRNRNGRSWQPNRRGIDPAELGSAGAALRYQVTMEPSNGRWLYALDLPDQVPQVDNNRAVPTEQLELSTLYPVEQRVRYEASSMLQHRWQSQADEAQLRPYLTLPSGFNPRTLELAARMRRDDDQAGAVDAVLANFRHDRYSYTLEPPLLGRDAVDQFLFETKAGFCEHYAGAFVFLMRAMAIPARVVTGYQGGELNPVDGYLTVRQSDAHAWAEIWLPARGWVRVDPTAAVAPERISLNLSRALPPRSPFGLQALGGMMVGFQGDGPGWLATLRDNMSALNNGWNQWVLDYNPERQRGFIEQLGAALVNWRALLALPLALALALLLRRWRARPRLDRLDALYLAFCRQQAKRGFPRAPHEGPQAYARRLRGGAAKSEQRDAMLRFLAIYSAIKYGVASDSQKSAALATLASLLPRSR
ncbi:MAG: DUF3488 and transglutaminase-like domain-containing protein [Pseudomonadota bacterium]